MKTINPEILLNLCKAISENPRFTKTWIKAIADFRTYCNMAVWIVARVFGIDLHGMRANAIYKYLHGSKEWRQIDAFHLDEAHRLINEGRLVIATEKGILVGHVAVGCPGPKVGSWKWKCKVFRVGNIGRDNGVMGLNYAFRQVPDIFVYDPEPPILQDIPSMPDNKYSSGLRPKA